MLDRLLSADRELFLKINRDWHHPWLDAFFPAITDLHRHWFFSYIFVPWLAIVFLRQFGRQGIALFIGLVLAAGTSDLLGGQVIKPYFERTRPTVAVAEGVTRAPEHGGFSFTSNHASNTFAAAVYAAQWIPQGRIVFLALAIAVAYSRVYVGVHYPLDVIAGAFLGIFCALLWVKIMERVLKMKRPVP